MKTSKITYVFFATVIVVVAGYWYVTRQSESYSEARNLIANNKIKVAAQDAQEKPVTMTKKEAYAERFKDSANDKARLDFALENQRPQKLAASVTQAMKSSYQSKLEEAKTDARTTRVYDGQRYSTGEVETKQERALELPHLTLQREEVQQPVQKPPVYRASVPKRKKVVEVHPEQVDIKQEPNVETNFFNTTSVNHTPTPTVVHEDTNSQQPQVIKAAVFGQQSLKQGALLKVRLMERVILGGATFDRNTFFSGICTFGQDRLLVRVNKIPKANGGYQSVDLALLDPHDYQEGLYAPSDNTKENAVEAATSGVENIISNVSTPGIGIGAGVARVFRTAVNGQQKITVSDGEPVIFISKVP